MVIIGVLLIVIGGGTAFTGMNKIDASEDWEPPSRAQDTCTVSVETNESESFVEAANDAERGCPSSAPVQNPYSGGERDVALGGVLVVIGGVSTYFGNKK